MATMNPVERAKAWLRAMRILAADGVDISSDSIQADVLAAIEATDDWADINQASYVSALPEPFKTWSTPRQKAAILAYVLQERFTIESE